MIRKAVIRDGDNFVVNVVSLPNGWTGATGEWEVPASQSIVDAGTGAPGDNWDGTQFIKPPPPPPPPSDATRVDKQAQNDLIWRAWVKRQAAKEGKTVRQIIDELKAELP